MMWLYGTGFPKSLNIGKALDKSAGAKREVIGFRDVGPDMRGDNYGRNDGGRMIAEMTAPTTDAAKLWDGWGTALKPAWEPIIVAMKPLASSFAENAMRHGVAGLNIDGGRIAGEPWKARSAAGLGSVKFFTEGEKPVVEKSPHDGGRWPANLLLDEAAAAALDAQTGDVGGGDNRGKCQGNRPGGFGDVGADIGSGEPCGRVYGDKGGASRFFYTAKASKSDRGGGNTHPTVKPLRLMQYLCTLTATPTGGIVLDPFAGSGSTLLAARECGRKAVGIEIEAEHCAIIARRLGVPAVSESAGAAC
jgi:site-specific DNA-methyltransferase (adenine-specific)